MVVWLACGSAVLDCSLTICVVCGFVLEFYGLMVWWVVLLGCFCILVVVLVFAGCGGLAGVLAVLGGFGVFLGSLVLGCCDMLFGAFRVC